MQRRSAALLVALVVATAPFFSGALAASDYALATDPTVPVPERTVTHNDDEYTIDAIARVTPGETLQVDVSAPDGALHDTYLYNDVEQIETASSEDQFTIDTGSLTQESGTFMLVLEGDDFNNQAVHPVVVSEYQTDLTSPDTADVGASVSVSGSIQALVENASDPTVRVVLGNDSARVTTTATFDGSPPNTSFSASVQTDDLTAGSYSIYAVVQGPDQAFGETELVALSDAHTVELQATEGSGGHQSTTTTTSSTGTTTSTTASTSSTTAGTSKATTDTATSTSSTVRTSTTATPGSTTTPTNTLPSTTTRSTSTTGSVITPNSPTTTPSTTTTETPLFRPTTILAVLGGLALFGFRRTG